MGVILRGAHFFGVKYVICGKGTVDAYNPKSVQSSMGSIFFVDVFYVELPEFLHTYRKETGNPIYGFFLDGDSITRIPKRNGLLMFGNEGHGISRNLSRFITYRVKIPSYMSDADSLNVASASCIAIYEFRRTFML